MPRYVLPLSELAKNNGLGSKASRLLFLKKKGYNVPETYVCPIQAFDDFKQSQEDTLARLEEELGRVIVPGREYYVSPSSNMEDSTGFSFAGQFESRLSAEGVVGVKESIGKTWLSAQGKMVKAYSERLERGEAEIKMAAIIQEKIAARMAGLIFTRNPLNGSDELILEYVRGPIEALVKGGATPVRWVYKWGKAIDKPDDAVSAEEQGVIRDVLLNAQKISRAYGRPVDLEWAHDGEKLYWLQLREITSLRGINIYSNSMAKERLPGMIKPLVWSINVPLINGSWKRLFTGLIGPNNLDINNMAKSFYYRAYFNVGVIGDVFELFGMPRESLEFMLGEAGERRMKFKPGLRSVRYVPRILLFILRNVNLSKKISRFLAAYKKKFDAYNKDVSRLGVAEIREEISSLYSLNQESSYYLIVSRLIEGMNNTLLRRMLAKRSIAINNLDFLKYSGRLKDIDPNHYLSELNRLYNRIPEEKRAGLFEVSNEGLAELPECRDFRRLMNEFLFRFGHLSDSSNDISKPHWSEDMQLIQRMITGYDSSRPATEGWVSKEIESNLNPFMRIVFRNIEEFRLNSARVGFLYTYGYLLFRKYFLRLGELFKREGFLEEPSDIFYLNYGEVERIIESGTMPGELLGELDKRKEEFLLYEGVVLPDVIVGDDPPPLLKTSLTIKRLRGMGSSRGYYEGPARIIKSMNEFHNLKEGDVLIVPYSDVSWTPLFVKAKAVVSESGGLLSHSSIVAREYGIPAVVAVKGALQIPDSARVAVDGNSGEVLVYG